MDLAPAIREESPLLPDEVDTNFWDQRPVLAFLELRPTMVCGSWLLDGQVPAQRHF
jgi:hypothetical protein